MKSVLASSVLGAALVFPGVSSAHDGFAISINVVRADYFHDHVLACGCRVSCRVHGGDHDYQHRHGRDGGYRDHRYDGGGYYGDRYSNDRYYDGRYRDDRYRDDRYRDDRGRRTYWHDHYVGRGGYVRCHVKGGVHYFRR